ncbi:MAG: glycosyltransferase [Bacillota bacterium]|nr:glycosyltransferase [Bacillota bacterium]
MKALILYTNTGGGHGSAARAAAEALTELDVEVRLLDILEAAGGKISDRVSKIYNAAVRGKPRIFGLFYNAGKKVSKANKRSVIYRLNSLYAARLNSIVREEQPHIILCTHLFAGQAITNIKRKFGLSSVTSAIITDYTYSPMWEETSLDYYFIPHEELRQQFVEKRMPSEKFFAMGMPVSSVFRENADKRTAKLKLEYDPDKFHALVTGGSMGAGNIFETVVKLSQAEKEMEITVICGSNRKVYDRLKALNLKENIRILQMTDRMAELMGCADVIISKPGGLTSTEAMTKGLPFIIITPIPGGEADNCDFFIKHGMAVHSKSAEETIQLCRLFKDNPQAARDMIFVQRKNIYPDSGRNIARFLIEKAEVGRG